MRVSASSIGDGVGQAAGRTYDRQRAVAQRDQLAEAARLEGTGHQEDNPSQRRCDARAPHRSRCARGCSASSPKARGRVAHRPHAPCRAPPVAGQIAQLVGDIGYEIEALLIDQAADDANQGHVWFVRQPKLLAQRGAIARLALGDILCGKLGGDDRRRSRDSRLPNRCRWGCQGRGEWRWNSNSSKPQPRSSV